MKYFVSLLCLLYQIPSYAIDSLQLHLQLEQLEIVSDTQKVKIYKDLSWGLRRQDIAKANELAKKGMSLAKTLGDSINYYELYANLGVIFTYESQYEKSIQCLNHVVTYFQKIKDDKKTAHALGQLGAITTRFGDFQKADSLLIMVSSIYERIKDDSNLMLVLMDRGANFRRWKKYKDAKHTYIQGLKLSQKLKSEKDAAGFLMGLGLVAVRQDNYAEGLEYYLQAAEGDYNDDLFKAKIFNNMGTLYDRLGELDKALEFHQKSLTIKRKLGLKQAIANSLNNMGLVYQKQLNYGAALKCHEEVLALRIKMKGTNNNLGGTIGNIGSVLLDLKKYDAAEEKFKEFLKISKEIDDQYDINSALSNLAKTYENSGQFKKGIDYGLQSLALAEEINFSRIAQTSAESLSACYKAIGNFKAALKYQNKYWVIKDSILGTDVSNKIAQLETKYVSLEKENELKLKKEQVINLENNRKIDQLKIKLLLLACAFFFFISGLLIYLYRKEKRNLRQSKDQAKQTIKGVNQEKQLLEQKISNQRLQLDNHIKQLLLNSERILEINKKSALSEKKENTEKIVSNLNDLLNQNLESEDGWKKFEHLFTLVHKDFYKNLNKTYPNLSNYDLKLSALIKLNINNKDIAQILGISPSSVKKARQRLYLKMNLKDNDALRNYIIQL